MMNDQFSGNKVPSTILREWSRILRERPEKLAELLSEHPLRTQLDAALSMAPGDRIGFLTNSPKPMRLVRMLPDAEFYLTVREAGPVDALPVLALASAEQIVHLLDLETWRGDRFDAKRAGAWAAVIMEAGESTLRRFVRNVDDEVLSMIFRQWAGIKQVEYDDQVPIDGAGESETGDERGFISPDGYFRFAPAVQAHAPAIRRLAEMLYHEEQKRYQEVMWTALLELTSELEEKALHWRQSRLEEHGYPPFEEAMSIYAPPLVDTGRLNEPGTRQEDESSPPRYPLAIIGGHGILQEAVENLDRHRFDLILRQMVSLANRVMVADSVDTGDLESHRRSMRKASGYVSIALADRSGDDITRAGRTLAEIPIMELFREGFQEAAKLQRRARRLLEDGWASSHPRALELLDQPLRPRIDGLLEPRPLYYRFSPDEVEPEYRDFETREELEETGSALDLAEIIGSVFIEMLHLDVPRLVRDADSRMDPPPRFSRLLLTLMAWHSTRGEFRLEPLPGPVAADFLRTVASRRTASPEAPDRALQKLVRAMGERMPLESRQAAGILAFGRACLKELASECARLDPGIPVSDREVSCLLIGGRDQENGES